MKTNRSFRAACITAAVAGVCSSMLVAAPAHATELSEATVKVAVSQAEVALHLDDDHVADDVSVLRDGDSVEATTTDGTLSVVTGIRDTTEQSSIRYTADRLDATTLRLAAVVPSPSDPDPSWDFGPGADLFALGDGRVSVSDNDGELLAGIDAPWALDAAGTVLPTTYSVEGSKLTQHIEYSPTTVFPVVADPKFTAFPGYWTATFNRAESASVVGTVATCAAVLSKSPVPALRALTIACAGLAAFSGAQLAGGKCVKVHVAGIPPMVGTWWPTFPKC